MKLQISNLDQLISSPGLYLKPNNTIPDALWAMVSTNTTGLPVVADGNILLGYVSLVDLITIQGINYRHKNEYSNIFEIPRNTVKEIMTSPAITVQETETVINVVRLLSQRHVLSTTVGSERGKTISSVPVVRQNIVIGAISYIDILKHIDVENTKVSQIATTSYIPVLSENNTLEAGYELLVSRGERNILVLNKNSFPVGIVTDLHLIRYMRQQQDFSQHFVGIAMSDTTIYSPIYPEDSLIKVVSLLTNPSYQFRVVPIIENHQLYGVISAIDILRALISSLSEEEDI